MMAALGVQLRRNVGWFDIGKRFEGRTLNAPDIVGPADRGAPGQEPRQETLPCRVTR